MKSRMSFVSRRPSHKDGDGQADGNSNSNTNNANSKDNAASGSSSPPAPEPMVKTPTAEGLGNNQSHSGAGGVAGGSGSGGVDYRSPSVSGRPSGLGLGGTSSSGTMSSSSGLTSSSRPSITGKSRNKSLVEGMARAPGSSGGVGKGPTVLRSGFLKKRGVINVAWKRRYFILTEDMLAYFDSEPKDLTATPKGLINLNMVTKVEHHTASSDDDCMFDICSPSRIYRLQADSVSDMEAWIATISGTAANHQQLARRRNTTHSAGGLRDVSEDANFRADAVLAGPHQPADLRKWEKMTPYDVSAWLETKGMSKHKQKFYKAGITGSHLKSLSTESLAQIGITEKSEQIKILNHIQKLIAEDGGFAGLTIEG